MSSRTIASGLAIVAAIVGYAVTASAQGECPQIALPNGTLLTCQVNASGLKVYIDTIGNSYPTAINGIGQFVVVNSSSTPCSAELLPVTIYLTSSNPILGTIRTTLDPSRLAPVSKIQSISPNPFPAIEDIYFYALTEFSGIPGRKYRSVTPLHFRSLNVLSFNPHHNERFTPVGRVEFEDVNRPGRTAFVLVVPDIILSGQ